MHEAREAAMPEGPSDETVDLQEALGLIGPRVLHATAGTFVRERWALASSALEEGVTVEWRTEGRVLATHDTVVALEFDLRDAARGELVKKTLQAVLRGPDWRLELPALHIHIHVG